MGTVKKIKKFHCDGEESSPPACLVDEYNLFWWIEQKQFQRTQPSPSFKKKTKVTKLAMLILAKHGVVVGYFDAVESNLDFI